MNWAFSCAPGPRASTVLLRYTCAHTGIWRFELEQTGSSVHIDGLAGRGTSCRVPCRLPLRHPRFPALKRLTRLTSSGKNRTECLPKALHEAVFGTGAEVVPVDAN